MPAGFLCGDGDVAQHGADVNRLAVVAAVIFAELLHAENIMQLVAPKCNEGGSRPDAKKFLAIMSLVQGNFRLPEMPLNDVDGSFQLPEMPMHNVQGGFRLRRMSRNDVQGSFWLPEMSMHNVQGGFWLPKMSMNNVQGNFWLPEIPLHDIQGIYF